VTGYAIVRDQDERWLEKAKAVAAKEERAAVITAQHTAAAAAASAEQSSVARRSMRSGGSIAATAANAADCSSSQNSTSSSTFCVGSLKALAVAERLLFYSVIHVCYGESALLYILYNAVIACDDQYCLPSMLVQQQVTAS
jgi:hypothetical protein